MTGTAVIARTNKIELHLLSVDIDVVSSFSAQLRLGHTHGRESYFIFTSDVKKTFSEVAD
jgi:hypothetical protein